MFLAAQWYGHNPRRGAVYVGAWSIHWEADGPVVYRDGRVQTLRERPRQAITVYHGLRRRLHVLLWPHYGYCRHGFHRTAWWHKCDYVTAANPDGRPSESELWPEDAPA